MNARVFRDSGLWKTEFLLSETYSRGSVSVSCWKLAIPEEDLSEFVARWAVGALLLASNRRRPHELLTVLAFLLLDDAS
jgi:hypothetical protein